MGRVSEPDCNSAARDRVDTLFEEHKKNGYPEFWSLVNRDRKKLIEICAFFCAIREFMKKKSEVAQAVRDHLVVRFGARVAGKAVCFPHALISEIKSCSTFQLAELKKLEVQGLVAPAFYLFASGSLGFNPQVVEYSLARRAEIPLKDARRDDYEPDGAAFFYWLEFAFLAAYADDEVAMEWKKVIPVLLKSTRIFALSYGQPLLGDIPPNRIRADYKAREFRRIHPVEASRFPLPSCDRFDELEIEATACARFAFPGEFRITEL